MEARFSRAVAPVVIALCFCVVNGPLGFAAGYRTANFTVDAPSPRLAKEIGDKAEYWREQLAQEWLGKTLPKWAKPCPIKARVAPSLGAGGATSFVFDRGEVFGWRMEIQGSRERILDSVLPHEVTHTIFASHFREPLPRWADEGACTTVEHHSEIAKQENMLIDFLKTQRGIPFDQMFVMTEYPQDVLPLYAQGHSLAKFLISQRGKREFLAFLADGMKTGDWTQAVHQRYGYRNLLVLQNSWMDWIRQGRPKLQLAADVVQVASHEAPASSRLPAQPTVVRGQNPTPPVRTASASVYSQASKPPKATAQQPATPQASPVTPGLPTAAQLWPAEQSELASSTPASVYDASRNAGTIRR